MNESLFRYSSINELDLSNKALICLKKLVIDNIDDLLMLPDEIIDEYKGLSLTTKNEIKNKKEELLKLDLDRKVTLDEYENWLKIPDIQSLVSAYFMKYDMHVDQMDIPNKSRNVLLNNNLYLLSEFIFYTFDDFLTLESSGKKTAENLLEVTTSILHDHKQRIIAFCSNGSYEVLDANNKYVNIFNAINNLDERNKVSVYLADEHITIDTLNLSKRAYNVLKENDIYLFSDLLKYNSADFSSFNNMGSRCISEILEAVKQVLLKYEDELLELVNSDDGHYISNRKIKNKIISILDDYAFIGVSYKQIEKALEHEIDKNRIAQVFGVIKKEKLVFKRAGSYFLEFPSIFDYLSKPLNVRDRQVMKYLLEGKTMEETGTLVDHLSKETVRKIKNKSLILLNNELLVKQGIIHFKEDRYLVLYENYNLDKKTFLEYINNDERYYNYMRLVNSSHGTAFLKEALEDERIPYSTKRHILKYIDSNYILFGNQRVERNKSAIDTYILETYCQQPKRYDELESYYQRFIKESGIENDGTLVDASNFHTLEGRLRNNDKALFGSKRSVRYYDKSQYDYKELIVRLALEQYHNTEVSTLKFTRGYPELMEMYDIRDHYELHNLLRKIIGEDNQLHMIFKKSPMIQFGDFNRDEMLYDTLLNVVPIPASDFLDLVCEEYGYDRRVFASSQEVSNLSKYLHDGIYTLEVKHMSNDQIELLGQHLTNDFYYIDDIRSIYASLIKGGDESYVNSYALGKLGFKVYKYSALRYQGTLEEYIRSKILYANDIDVTELKKDFAKSVNFYSVLENLKETRTIIQYAKNKYYTLEYLESKGVNKEKINRFVDLVDEITYEDAYFNVELLKNKGYELSIDSDIELTDFFYDSLIYHDNRFSGCRSYGTYILVKGKQHVTRRRFLKDLVVNKVVIEVDYMLDLLHFVYGMNIKEKREVISQLNGTGVYYDPIEAVYYATHDDYLEIEDTLWQANEAYDEYLEDE